jgi:tRNA threonylcarbamoyladenosine biosynthesis protein TsaB
MPRMKILNINTSQMGKVEVELKVQGTEYKVQREQKFGSQVLLNMIEELLEKGGIEVKDLDEIKVSTGPGSFTGLRVGVSVANALAFGLGVPVNGKQVETDLIY